MCQEKDQYTYQLQAVVMSLNLNKTKDQELAVDINIRCSVLCKDRYYK